MQASILFADGRSITLDQTYRRTDDLKDLLYRYLPPGTLPLGG